MLVFFIIVCQYLGSIIGFMFIADQFPGADNGARVAFLNQPTYMFDGAEKLD